MYYISNIKLKDALAILGEHLIKGALRRGDLNLV